MRIQKINKTLYEKYRDSQLGQKMMADLEYVKTVNVTKAQSEGTNANVSAKKV